MVEIKAQRNDGKIFHLKYPDLGKMAVDYIEEPEKFPFDENKLLYAKVGDTVFHNFTTFGELREELGL